MKTISIVVSFVLTFLVSNTIFSQDTIQIIIDTSFCSKNSQLKGEFGFYGTTKYHPRIDTLLDSLSFVHSQEIILPSDNFINLRLVYTPTDTSYSKVVAPLTYFRLDNFRTTHKKTIRLDRYFFRNPASLLDCMVNGDTLLITKEEHRGMSVQGQIYPRSTLRITKKGNQFYYSRNNLPTNGNLRVFRYRKGEYEAGYSARSALTQEQLLSIRQFETEVAKFASYAYGGDYFDIGIKLKGESIKCVLLNQRPKNEKAHFIWEKLK